MGRYQTTLATLCFKRTIILDNAVPYISFTFDDFPRSALRAGGEILVSSGLRATYYASFGRMGKASEPGAAFTLEDVERLVAQGHELGCHTYDHCHSWDTHPEAFEASILKNRSALAEVVPGAVFRSFSYPIIGPRPDTKRRAGKYFGSCRWGGQTYNVGNTDLNLMKAYFLEKTRGNIGLVKEIIEKTCEARGWLIFATHDIDEDPSPYGCTPSFFEEIIKYSLDSGARILPVAEALDDICSNSSNRR